MFGGSLVVVPWPVCDALQMVRRSEPGSFGAEFLERRKREADFAEERTPEWNLIKKPAALFRRHVKSK